DQDRDIAIADAFRATFAVPRELALGEVVVELGFAALALRDQSLDLFDLFYPFELLGRCARTGARALEYCLVDDGRTPGEPHDESGAFALGFPCAHLRSDHQFRPRYGWRRFHDLRRWLRT